MTKMKRLTPQRQAFADAYIRTSDGVGSAREAGYTGNDRTLAAHASRLQRATEIAGYIRRAMDRAAQRVDVDAEWIVGRLKDEASVSEATTPGSRVKALDLLAKRISGFYAPTKTELTGADGGPIETRYANYSDAEIDKLIVAKAAGLGMKLGK